MKQNLKKKTTMGLYLLGAVGAIILPVASYLYVRLSINETFYMGRSWFHIRRARGLDVVVFGRGGWKEDYEHFSIKNRNLYDMIDPNSGRADGKIDRITKHIDGKEIKLTRKEHYATNKSEFDQVSKDAAELKKYMVKELAKKGFVY